MLPFTRVEFIALFAQYNADVWPAQVVAYVLGLALLAALWRPSRAGDRFIAVGLAAMWLWTGIAYHWLQFSAINPAAFGFAALFVLQGVLFLVAAARGTLRFGPPRRPAAWVGAALAGYALVLYPLIGRLVGHEYPAVPVFGIAPCPVVIFTFGLLLMASPHVSRWLLAVPFAWSLVGGSAAFLLGVPQDWLLLVSGLVAVPMIVLGERQAARRGEGALASPRAT
jgi:hypothetical protein